VSRDCPRVNLGEYSKEKLWQLLVETVHASVMFPTRKAYTRDTILAQQPDISTLELAERLGMTLGEAIVILSELRTENKENFRNVHNHTLGLVEKKSECIHNPRMSRTNVHLLLSFTWASPKVGTI
jgi:hypothetical protein